MSYSLAEAAKAVGRTKPAILSAIQKGHISAKKNAFGHWEIDPSELHRVYRPVDKPVDEISRSLSELLEEKKGKIRELEARLEAADELKREIQARNEELRKERDDWKAEAEEWKNQVKALPAGAKEKKRSLLKRIFGG